jgi:bleomycin hydrolase
MADFMPLDEDRLDRLVRSFDAREANKLALNAVTKNGLGAVAFDHDTSRNLPPVFSLKIDQGTVTNQRRSGRCWLFSSLNVARFIAKREMGIAKQDFEFSQNYAMYWDKLERANYFLQDMAALVQAGEPADSRLVQFQLGSVMGDGGQWTMAMNLYKKYGAVPKQFYPETASSKNTSEMDTQLQHMLRDAVCRLYAAKGDPDGLKAIVADGVERAHTILNIHLGVPPTRFDWEYTDDDDQFHRDGQMTPVEFWNKYVGPGHLEDYVCLVADPRSEHKPGQVLAIEHLGNVAGGDPTEYLNVTIEDLKLMTLKALQTTKAPVWFGSQSGPYMDRQGGGMSTRLYDYQSVYGFEPSSMTKEERVRFADSAMNHAMAFDGVDVADDGQPRRWRVENSWGADIADKGYFTLADDWFDAYVFEAAVPKSVIPADLLAGYDKPRVMLPAWDPMGALA